MINLMKKLPISNIRRYFGVESNSNSIIEKLTNRSVIRLKGPDSGTFLQGLITNDVEHLSRGSTCMYTMFLNTGGRVLYDAIVYKTEENDSFLIECDKEIASELQNHLKMFRIRKKVDISNVEDEINVWVALNFTKQINSHKDIIITTDPRVKLLGYRILVNDYSKIDELDLVKTTDLTSDNYKLIRYELGIAEGISELIPGKALPLESNCDYLHGVSFFKGCYLGQELTARTYHTGVIRKRIMPFILEKNVDHVANMQVENSAKKSIGIIRGLHKGRGIGLLRVEEALKSNQSFNVQGVDCKTWRPEWWPKEAPPIEKSQN